MRVADSRPERGQDSPTSRADQVLGYTIAPEPRYDITLDEVQEAVRNHTAVIIDARTPAVFATGHVRGAINVPAARKEAYWQQVSAIARDQLVILYCYGPSCDWADTVYDYLASMGFRNMRVFKPGWEALRAVDELR